MFYVGMTIPKGEGAILVKTCPTSLTPYELQSGLVRVAARTRHRQTLDCKRLMSLLSAVKRGIAHSRRNLISMIALFSHFLTFWVFYWNMVLTIEVKNNL